MSIVKKEVEIAKEVSDVMELLVSLAGTIKSKGDYSALLPQLIAAVDGVTGAEDEWKTNPGVVEATVGYHVGKLASALTAKSQA